MFNTRLKELRLSKGDTQASLAQKMGVSSRTIASYEQGINEPSMETLINLSNYFNVTTDYLIGRSECKTIDMQKLYDEIGLSENSIGLLKSMTIFRDETKELSISQLSPINCVDFCLSRNDLSLRLFDSIYSYFLAHIRSDQKVYISKSGKLIINPNPSDNLGVFQTINNRYLESSILQEITEQLKEFKSEYQKINGITKGTP